MLIQRDKINLDCDYLFEAIKRGMHYPEVFLANQMTTGFINLYCAHSLVLHQEILFSKRYFGELSLLLIEIIHKDSFQLY